MRTLALAVTIILSTAVSAVPCTVFCGKRGDVVLAGNNEDWSSPHAVMTVVPPEEGKHGVVYFGFEGAPQQGGVNDRGLFFDYTATGLREATASKGRKKADPTALMHRVMTECATVKEALAVFEEHDLGFMKYHQTILGDRTGDSAIVEGDTVLRRAGDFQVVTNFHQSTVPPEKRTCTRFLAAERMLGDPRNVSVEGFRRILKAVRQDITQYSNIYDLTNNVVHLYLFHDFDLAVTLTLDQLFEKGKRVVKIRTLFPRNEALTAYMGKLEKAVEDRLAERGDAEVAGKALDACVGTYMLEEMPEVKLSVAREGDHLVARGAEGEPVRLRAESETRFYAISAANGETDVTFLLGEGGAVTGMEIHVKLLDRRYRLKRSGAK